MLLSLGLGNDWPSVSQNGGPFIRHTGQLQLLCKASLLLHLTNKPRDRSHFYWLHKNGNWKCLILYKLLTCWETWSCWKNFIAIKNHVLFLIIVHANLTLTSWPITFPWTNFSEHRYSRPPFYLSICLSANYLTQQQINFNDCTAVSLLQIFRFVFHYWVILMH